ncbi:MAG: glycosyl transferase group 1, partial [Solirubrobacterales bacterium]|nr:glycosyl transferase group 1 [Solirubrobacterales bacterium]
GYGRPRDEWRAAAALTTLLRDGGFDLVHCHSAKAGVLGRIAGRRAGVPAIYSPHGLPFVGPVSRARRVFGIAAERRLAGRTAAYLFVSDAERRFALAAGVGAGRPMHVVHNGCDADGHTPPDPALRAFAGDGPLAAMVSVLRPAKGIETFIDAAPAVLAAVPGARLALVGSGPMQEEFAARVRERGLAAEPRFAMLPWRPPMAAHLKALDVLALPSEMEAFPLSLVEAMAHGVPQVASDVGGIPEAVTAETGILIGPRDPAALALALGDLLADPARRARLADGSRARHAAHFTLERMVSGVAAVYDAVLA